MDYSSIPAARLDAQQKHLMRWKITLLHLQPNFLRCSCIENISVLIFIVQQKNKEVNISFCGPNSKLTCHRISNLQEREKYTLTLSENAVKPLSLDMGI